MSVPVATGLPELPEYQVRTGLALSMVTTHDCHLDREFLEFYAKLRASQVPKDEAIAQAESNPELDRFLQVSPLLPITVFRAHRDAIFKHEVIGLFPVPARDDVGILEGAVDLSCRATIERHIIVERLAVLSEPSRTDLRYALARLDALRTPVIGFEIERAVGRKIRAVRSGEKVGSVVLELNDGEVLELLLRPAEVAHGGPERKRAPTA